MPINKDDIEEDVMGVLADPLKVSLRDVVSSMLSNMPPETIIRLQEQVAQGMKDPELLATYMLVALADMRKTLGICMEVLIDHGMVTLETHEAETPQ